MTDGKRPMTERERAAVIALTKCSFLPASWDKRFVRDMADKAEVSEKQAASIARLAWRYRKQLPPDVRPVREPIPGRAW